MSPKTKNKSIVAEDGRATRKLQREDKSKAGAMSDGEKARALRSDLRVDLSGKRKQGSKEIKKGSVTEEEEGAGAKEPLRGSQGLPEDLRLVKRNVSI